VRREPPHWDALPRALADDRGLRTVSLAAGRAGVRAGMTLTEAQARCAALEIRTWDDHAISDAILAATTAFLAASPQVTPVSGAPGMWWIGANGFTALGGEETLARTLLGIAQRWHPDARVAIADSCVAARAATWAPQARSRVVRERDPLALPDGITCIPGGQCATYLAPAPLGLVPMDDELREALTALGLRTVGTLAALDPGDIERRWGADGLMAWRLAHGDDPRRPGLVRVEATRSTSVELPVAVGSTAPVLFVLRAQLERLLRELIDDGRAAAAVSITLILDAGRQWPLEDVGSDGREHETFQETSSDATAERASSHRASSHRAVSPDITHDGMRDTLRERDAASLLSIPQRSITREVRPARPLARLEPLFDQCRALLERWVIPAPIIGVTVGIPATAPLAADQGDLLIPSWRDAAMNAESVFARLRAALDPDNTGDVVVRAVAGDAHKPEATGRWASADAMLQAQAPVPAVVPASVSAPVVAPDDDESAHAVLRLLEAPDEVEIEAPHGVPSAIWWHGRRVCITDADGPERLSGDWWRADVFARDYWRCTAADEGELLLYAESARWFVQGWYD
jgi:protein ImuB